MSLDPAPPNGTIAAPAPPSRRRIRFAIRLRTMLLIVLAVAGALGYRDYRKRRDAVDDLVSRVPVGVYLSVGPTSPHHDGVFDPGGTFAAASRRVRELQVEDAAVADLVVALREARIAGDEKRLRGALAALQGLGPAIKAARPEVIRVARGEGLEGRAFLLVRGLAVHVLAKVAKEDRAALPDLVALMSLPDASPQRQILASVVNELAPFGAEAGAAVPGLIAALDASPRDPMDLGVGAIVATLGSIGPDAREALPRLIAVARDRSRGDLERTWAVAAVASISGSPGSGSPILPLPGASTPLTDFLDEMARDDVEQVASGATFHRERIRQVAEMNRRREAMKILIASDRALGGRPRPRATPNP